VVELPKLLLLLPPLPVVEFPKPLRADGPVRLPPLKPLRLLPFVKPLKLLELPMLLPLEPAIELALDPVVDVPLEPTTGVLGATGAVLGVTLPVAVLGGLPVPKGVGRDNAARPTGRTPIRSG
jgi:hypothetical protein